MEFSTVISTRRDIRKYRATPVPADVLAKLYEALRLAPSGSNQQPFRFVFVKDPALRKEIAAKACHQEFIAGAPVIMAACCEPGRAFDTAIAVDHLALAATDLGLGTCWIGWFEREPVRTILGIPESQEVPVLMTIGFADKNPAARKRKTVAELVKIDRYG